MRTYIKLLFVIILTTLGCVPEDDAFLATSFEKVATVSAPANVAYIKNVSNGATIPVGLLGKSEAKDIKSVKLYIEFVAGDASPDPAAEQELTEITTYPSSVVIENNDLMEIAGKNSVDELSPGDRWIVKYEIIQVNGKILTGGTKTNITFTCASDLEGTYDFSTTDIVSGDGSDLSGCGGTTTGEGELEEVSEGVYAFTDNTFNMFNCAYGVAASQGTLTISHLCGKISWEGKDQYGDTYTMTIVNNDGTNLTFEWVNTYGDGGTTTLTRTDDKSWPLDLYTE